NRREAALFKWKRTADVWCASWFPKPAHAVPPAAFTAISDSILTGRSALSPAIVEPYLQAADAIARERRFFHWELEFPEVFFDPVGNPLSRPGFDAVIGNPPWDMIRADAGSDE